MIATMSTDQPRPTTGHDRAYWFAELDAWGAAGRPYREIADWLTTELGLSAWWAQKLIVEYEEARGLRDRGARRDGTFAAGASRTWLPRSKRSSKASRTRSLASAGCPASPSSCGRPSPRSSASAARRHAPPGAVRRQTQEQDDRRRRAPALPDAALVPTMRGYWQERRTRSGPFSRNDRFPGACEPAAPFTASRPALTIGSVLATASASSSGTP